MNAPLTTSHISTSGFEEDRHGFVTVKCAWSTPTTLADAARRLLNA